MRWFVLSLMLSGCNDTQYSITPEDTLGLEDAEVQMILAFLNDCSTTQDLLDHDVPLDADTAKSIISHRDGSDSQCGTVDDDLYDNLTEVDAVPNVGVSSINQIWLYLSSDPLPDDGSGTWDGVDFTAEEAASVLEIANQASEPELTDGVGLTDYRAAIIMDNRDYDSMDKLAGITGIGEETLRDLLEYVPTWDANH